MIKLLSNQSSATEQFTLEDAESIFAIPKEEDDFIVFNYTDAIGDLDNLLKEFSNIKPEPNDQDH